VYCMQQVHVDCCGAAAPTATIDRCPERDEIYKSYPCGHGLCVMVSSLCCFGTRRTSAVVVPKHGRVQGVQSLDSMYINLFFRV
jgi:hypothetical protein